MIDLIRSLYKSKYNIPCIGMLRQWLNEKPKDQMVTTEDLEKWLEPLIKEADGLNKLRYSWDIAESKGEWCVQIWYGDVPLDCIDSQSNKEGVVNIAEALANYKSQTSV